jgi:hypothetical protein
MMRKDVSAGEEVQNQNIRKNDKKRHFRSWRGKISKNPKNDEKSRFRRWS